MKLLGMVEMDMFVKNRAKAAFFINKDVASNKVNLHDGAMALVKFLLIVLMTRALGTETLIIDRGILKTGICVMPFLFYSMLNLQGTAKEKVIKIRPIPV